MNRSYFVIDSLIIGIYLMTTLIDNGCECLSTLNNSIVRKANFPRVNVAPRNITGALSSNSKLENIVIEVTKTELDIDNY